MLFRSKVTDGYVAVGYSNSFGSGDWATVTGKGSRDAIFVKYDMSGEIVWKRNFGGSSSDSYNSVTAISNGYVAVGSSGARSFGNGDWEGVTTTGYNYCTDSIIVKYNAIGDVVWKKNLCGPSDDNYSSVTAGNYGYVAVGYSNLFGSNDWTGISGKGDDDAIIVKYNSAESLLMKPLVNNTFGIYKDGLQLNIFPESAGTYTIKAQYTNNTGKITNISFVIAVKCYNNLLKTYIIPARNIAIDGVVDISQDIELPSATLSPNLEVKVMVFESLSVLAPLAVGRRMGR